MAITRTAMVDDDGSGTTGTIINNAWKTELYNQIDAALGGGGAYSEGTWTPGVTGASGGSGQAYANQSGSYVKTGKLVQAVGTFRLSAKGTFTGAVVLNGLPFPAGSSPMGGAIAVSYYELAVPIYFMTGFVQASAGFLKVVKAAGAAYADLAAADLNENSAFTLAITYITA